MKMPIKEQVKSKGMLAGIGLICLGIYVVVAQADATGGMTVMGLGLGILGIRDAQ